MDFLRLSFKYITCNHSTSIYFESNKGIDELVEYKKCTICVNYQNVYSGDLGYRTDIENADFTPWQAQFVRIDPALNICSICLVKNSIELSYANLIAECPCCGYSTMRVTEICNKSNASLARLIKKIKN